jgi:hypothetical protein
MAWPFAAGALHRRPRPHELALELQCRRRAIARLDRHHCDIAHWGLDMDQTGGPLEIESSVGEFPPANAIWNTCTKYRITLKYPKDITMIIAGGHGDIKGGAKWIGTEGFVSVDRGRFDATDLNWRAKLPDDCKVQLYASDNHQANFIACVKSRKPTITPVETGHHSAIPGHLSLISLLTGQDENGQRIGRQLKWDAEKEIARWLVRTCNRYQNQYQTASNRYLSMGADTHGFQIQNVPKNLKNSP